MKSTEHTNTTTPTRRAVLLGAAALPTAAAAASAPLATPLDADIPLVEAWSEACGIVARLPYADGDAPAGMVDRLADLHRFIADTAAASLIGVGIKLRLLSWLHQTGSAAP